jgi:hypothetical protein
VWDTAPQPEGSAPTGANIARADVRAAHARHRRARPLVPQRRRSPGALRREIELTRDPELESLYDELLAYPGVAAEHDRAHPQSPNDILLTHELRLQDTQLALFSTITSFGTARDLTLGELTIEAFYPANSHTAGALTAAVPKTRPS